LKTAQITEMSAALALLASPMQQMLPFKTYSCIM